MPPQRIVIVGCSGSGKSTLARKLGLRLGLPVVHLDVLLYLPGWKRAEPRFEFERALGRRIGAKKPGSTKANFASWTFDIRLARAESIIVLERPAGFACGESFGAPPWSGAIDPICHLVAPSKSIGTYWSTSGILERSDGPRSRQLRSRARPPRFRCSGSVAIAKSPRFWRRRGSRGTSPSRCEIWRLRNRVNAFGR